MAVAEGMAVEAALAPTVAEVLGINDRAQLAGLETTLRGRIAADLMAAGVTLVDPARIDVRGRLSCGRDVHIDVNAVFEGAVELGEGVSIGANVIIRNSRLGPGCVVHPNTLIEDADIGPRCELGPFARLRPGAELAEGVKIGNFVELKKSRLGAGQQGESPQLRRRCGDWDARQRRRGHDHVQLRRREQAPHGHRRRRVHRLQHGAGGAGHHRRGGDHRRRVDGVQGRAGGRADRGAQQAGDRARLEAPGEATEIDDGRAAGHGGAARGQHRCAES
jgi:acyl-[acyl carrier protein]--UDP-N-acetylglucosamine O-acyltransferase